MSELPPNLQLALKACREVAQTTPTGEVSFRDIPQEYKDQGITHHDLARLQKLGHLERMGEGRYVLGVYFPEAFDWWRKQYKWHRFPFECECGGEIPIRHRVTQVTRHCPNCGEPVTVEAIDDQLRSREPERQRKIEMERKSGFLSTIGTIGVVAAAGVMYGVSLFFGKKR